MYFTHSSQPLFYSLLFTGNTTPLIGNTHSSLMEIL